MFTSEEADRELERLLYTKPETERFCPIINGYCRGMECICFEPPVKWSVPEGYVIKSASCKNMMMFANRNPLKRGERPMANGI